MFWNKIKSSEYKELKIQIELLAIDIDILTERYRRKVKPKETPEEIKGSTSIDDGFDEIRRIYKEQHP